MQNRTLIAAFVVALSFNLLGGCDTKEFRPISIDVAKEIKSGTSLDEINRTLGEPHSPTAMQANHLDTIVTGMPEPMRANAQQDQSLAWGSDHEFLVAKVNDKGIAWVVGWRAGSN